MEPRSRRDRMMLKAYRSPEQSSFLAESASLSVIFNFMRRWIVIIYPAHQAAVDFRPGVAKALVRPRPPIQAPVLPQPQP